MDVVELPEDSFLQLRPSIHGMLLQHLGCGAEAIIEAPCTLTFDDSGIGFLSFKDEVEHGTPDWASAWLNQLALVRPNQTSYTNRDLGVLTLADNKVTPRDTVLLDTFKVRVVKFVPSGQPPLFLEAFVSNVGRGGSFLRWGLSRLVHHVKGADHQGNYLSKAVANYWTPWIAKLKFSEDVLRPSRRSHRDRVLEAGQSVDRAEMAFYDPDWSVSMEGFYCVLLHMASSERIQKHHVAGMHLRAIEFMQMMNEIFIGDNFTVLHLTDENDKHIGSVKVNKFEVVHNLEDHISMPDEWSSLIGATPTPLVALLLKLSLVIRQPSRHGKSRPSAAMALLHNLVDFLSASAEFQRSDKKIFETHDHISMPEIYREGSRWPRRISATMKLTTSKAVMLQPSLRNAQQLLAARRLCLYDIRDDERHLQGSAPGKKKKEQKGVTAAYGREFCQANMLSYMATAKALLGKHNHSYIGLDGTQVTSKNLDFYLFENLPKGRSAWMIPKAFVFR